MTEESQTLYDLIRTKLEARSQAHIVAEKQLQDSIGELCGELLAIKAQLADLRTATTHHGNTLSEHHRLLDALAARIDLHIRKPH